MSYLCLYIILNALTFTITLTLLSLIGELRKVEGDRASERSPTLHPTIRLAGFELISSG